MKSILTALLAVVLLSAPAYASEGLQITLSPGRARQAGTPPSVNVYPPGTARISATASVSSAGKTRFTFTWYAPDGAVRSSTARLAFPSKDGDTAAATDFFDGPRPEGWWRLEVSADGAKRTAEFLVTDDPAALAMGGTDAQAKLDALGLLDDGRPGHEDVLKLAYMDGDPAVRAAAVSAAGGIGGDASGRFIVDAAADPSEVVRASAAQAAALHSGEAIGLLTALVSDETVIVRLSAARALGGLDAGFAAPLLGRLMTDNNPTVRDTALASLGGFDGTPAIDALSKGLTVDDPSFRGKVLAVVSDKSGSGRTELLTGLLGDDDPAVRLGALEALVKSGTDWPVDKAVPLVDDPDEPTALAALGLLAGLGDTTAVDAALGSAHGSVRLRALDYALKEGGASGAAHLGLAAGSDDPLIRARALEGLVALGETGLPGLVMALDSTDDEVREGAATAIRNLSATGAEDAMLKAASASEPAVRAAAIGYLAARRVPGVYRLLEDAAADPAAEVRRAGLDALLDMGGEGAAGPLGAYYASCGVQDRYMVVGTLSLVPGEEADALLVRALADAEPGIRTLAVRALAARGKAGEVAGLVRDEDQNVRRAALEAVSASPGPETLEALTYALADPEAGSRMLALKGLAGIDGPDASSALSSALEDGSPAVRELAVRLLMERRDEGAAGGLASLLGDGRPAVRERAAEALAGIKGDKADEALYGVLLNGGTDAKLMSLGLLERRGSVRLVDGVARSLTDRDAGVRQAALSAASGLDMDGRRRVYIEASSSAYAEIRLAGVRGLQGMEDDESAAALGRALSDDEPRVRLAAVEGLAGLDMPGLSGRLALLADDPDHGVAETVFDAARTRGWTEVMLKSAAGRHRDIARRAMDHLIEHPDMASLPGYDAYFASGYRRMDIIRAAGSLPGDGVSFYLCGFYRASGGDGLLRKEAVRSLAGRGDDALPCLREALADASAEVRIEAVNSLSRMGVKDGVAQALGAGMSDTRREVRQASLKAISSLDDPGAARYALPALDDPELRPEAFEIISKSAGADTLPELAKDAGRVHDPSARAELVGMLASRGLDAGTLCGFIDDVAAEVRLEAVRRLAQKSGSEAAYCILKAGSGTDYAVRETAADALADMQAVTVEDAVNAHFDRGTADAAVVGFAARVLRDADGLARMVSRIQPSDTVRLRAALQPLANRHAPQDVKALIEGLKADDAKLRSEILSGLSRTGPGAADDALSTAVERYPELGAQAVALAKENGLSGKVARAALRHGDTATRIAAVRALEGMPCDITADTLSTALTDRDEAVALASVDTAGRSGCTDVVVRAASVGTPAVRAAAAGQLGNSGAAVAVDALSRLAADADTGVSEAAVSALTRLGGAVPSDAWAAIAGKPAPAKTRMAALDALAGRKDAGYAELFADALGSGDAKLAEAGVRGLVSAGPGVLGAVHPLLADPKSGPYAVRVAGMIADSSSETPLIALLPSLSGEQLAAAVEALGRIGGEGSVKPLAAVYDRGDSRARLAVLKALPMLGLPGDDPAAGGILKGAIEDEDESIRFYAARAAGVLGGEGLEGPIRDRLARESSALVSGELERALDNISAAISPQ